MTARPAHATSLLTAHDSDTTTASPIAPPRTQNARRTARTPHSSVAGSTYVPDCKPQRHDTVDYERLAHAIAHEGMALLSQQHLNDLATAARAVDASPVLIDILVDTTQTDIARARAYGRITTKILNAAWARPSPTDSG